MPCYNPLAGFRSKEINPKTGKNFIYVSSGDFIHKGKEYFCVPCGKCIGCRLEHARQWSVRCLHESKMWKDNCFITLTFDEKNEFKCHSLVKDDFVVFMKKLRHFDCRYRFLPKFRKYVLGHKFMWRTKSNVRFFHCGEYGDINGRAHHHACLFNFDFKDKVLWDTRHGVRLFRSKSLEKLWPFGFSTIGDVTAESAAYVARYVMKKINSKPDASKVPPYITMSRRPGIGYKWLEKFSSDVYPNDYVVVNGFTAKPPRFYDEKYSLTNADDFSKIKDIRINAAINSPDNSYSRLKVREVVAEAKAANLRRSL